MPTSSSRGPPPNDARRVHALVAAPSRQRGVALILVLMLAVTASSFVVLTALNNRSSRETSQRVATVEALGQARSALIGYAVGYADGRPSRAREKGPGRLPCPDLAGGSPQGSAESATGDCRAASDRETGLLPFRTLGLSTLADGSGAPLWYAVSESFRSMASGVLNSETEGSFSVDDTGDVVAVIVAPGPPLTGQVRNSASAYSVAAWLEGENASLGDNRFTRDIQAHGNDTMMIITRGELMVEVEKMVIKEVERALYNYRHDPDGDDSLPWLAPRAATNFVGKVGEGTTALARLPLHELGKTFDAEFTAQWSLAGTGAVIFSGAEPPAESCLRHSACTQNINDKPAVGPPTPTPVTFPATVFGVPSALWNQGRCTLERDKDPPPRALNLSRCTFVRNKDAPRALNLTCTTDYSYAVAGRSLRRVYQFEVCGNTHLVAPSLTARRTLEVRAAGSAAWPAGTLARITISDLEGPTIIGTGELDFSTLAATDSIEVSQIPFDLEVWTEPSPLDRHLSPGALPPWLFADKWHESLLIRYAPSEAPGYSGDGCQVDGTCLTLRMKHPGDALATDVIGVRGIVVAPGPPLSSQSRPPANLSDYLEGDNKPDEGDNNSETLTYERREPSSSFNDQILPLSP